MISLKRRLLAKTLTYKIASLASGVLIIGITTDSWAFAGGLASVLLAVNTTLYLLHEWLWNKTAWGKIEDPS